MSTPNPIASRTRPGVYLAGPFGFTEPGRRWLAEVVLPRLSSSGLTPLDPWEVGGTILAPVLAGPVRDREAVLAACAAVGAANEALIDECAAVLALVDGCDLDSGTCAEIGYAVGIGKPVVGLRTDTRSAGDVAELAINLQVKHFIERSGGTLTTELDEALAALLKLVGARGSPT